MFSKELPLHQLQDEGKVSQKKGGWGLSNSVLKESLSSSLALLFFVEGEVECSVEGMHKLA